MRFSEDFIEKVLQATDLVEVIAPHTELKEKGDRLWGRCPFPDHAEKTPSFSVSRGQQLYYCFGCKKGGNVFTFLNQYNGLNFPEAVEVLARKAALPLPEGDSPQRTARRESKDLLAKINKTAAVYFHHQLKSLTEEDPVAKYAVGRGLTAEIIETFKLGLAADSWQGLTQFLENKKVPLVAAETLGLIKRKKTGSEFFDLFRERLMFPIFSPSGDVLGFGGRTYSDGTPKYLNSPETPLFSKGRVLYGLYETGKFIRSKDQAIVVEGYMDAIALYAAGFQNVVAILGTAFTAEHAKLIKRYSNHVTMLLDGDEAGITAAERSLPILLEAGLRVKGCFLPEGLDPDEFIKVRGAAQLQNEIEHARELFSLVLGRWLQNYRGSAGEKVDIVQKAAPLLRITLSQQLAALYIEEIAQRLDVEIPWVQRTLREWSNAEKARQATTPQKAQGAVVAVSAPAVPQALALQDSPESPPLISIQNAPRDEAFLVNLLLHSRELFAEAQAEGVFEMLTHDGLRKLTALASERYRQKPDDFDRLAASLASQVDSPSAISSRADSDETEERRLMIDYLTAIRNRFLKNQAKVLANQLRDNSSPELRVQTLEQFMNIQRNRLAINRDGRE